MGCAVLCGTVWAVVYCEGQCGQCGLWCVVEDSVGCGVLCGAVWAV